MGLIADLTAGEIVEQAVHALQRAPFKNVVFMGMVNPVLINLPILRSGFLAGIRAVATLYKYCHLTCVLNLPQQIYQILLYLIKAA